MELHVSCCWHLCCCRPWREPTKFRNSWLHFVVSGCRWGFQNHQHHFLYHFFFFFGAYSNDTFIFIHVFICFFKRKFLLLLRRKWVLLVRLTKEMPHNAENSWCWKFFVPQNLHLYSFESLDFWSQDMSMSSIFDGPPSDLIFFFKFLNICCLANYY